ncbi:nuclear transport factor 2 family protein [Paenibacillus puldeungensis]|uniref:Nuclear transport factor 2 family protein n=1 Tax=Paenibacillus puldeungensis TaxID=696536 RepID=A0ABW3RQR7_9BACL
MDINQLPQIINDFLNASNKPDPNAFVDCFSDDAIVVDEGQERIGKAAIKKWSDENHFGANVTLEPRNARRDDDEIIVACKVDGDFDKTGLPDPLVLSYYFRMQDGKIARLYIELS